MGLAGMTATLEAYGLHAPGRLARTDLRLIAGELTLLVGPNGAGKTSLLHGLAGIDGIAGDVRIEGVKLAELGPVERVKRVALLPASRDLRWPLNGHDLVTLGLGGLADDGAVGEVLAMLDANELAGRRVDRLSTGERARILLARALVARPAVLLLDEPAANLDPRWQLRVVERLRAEARRGAAVLASLHDLALARANADRVIVMTGGAIVADGPPAEALSDGVLSKVFGIAWSDHGWTAAA
jgi:iron complex transport system ATP-binding protein